MAHFVPPISIPDTTRIFQSAPFINKSIRNIPNTKKTIKTAICIVASFVTRYFINSCVFYYALFFLLSQYIIKLFLISILIFGAIHKNQNRKHFIPPQFLLTLTMNNLAPLKKHPLQSGCLTVSHIKNTAPISTEAVFCVKPTAHLYKHAAQQVIHADFPELRHYLRSPLQQPGTSPYPDNPHRSPYPFSMRTDECHRDYRKIRF